ncbi:hypothetical protein EDD96_5663 [Streptomyces sp. Ag109_G2-6]|uniref:hypothetical protein n=1 Tax=Streptomyces TaxID=1883 RepID=UPI0009A558AB|nr:MULTISPECIES: hypothetical protein [Streptomyces]RPF41838.1 hypothetical protein EDD96_5663 [Streptomyces sp. Ag109_G2-6]
MTNTPHPLQAPLINLVDYLRDARLIHEVVESQLQQTTAERLARGYKTGAGQPKVQHKSLNRAVVVASVGAWEAFCEDLALAAQTQDSQATPPKDNWYKIDGPKGIVQTPNSNNVGRLFWTFFRYDPIPDWSLDVQVSPSELGYGTGWRVANKSYQAAEAAGFLDAMVKVRHGFAHQDKAQKPPEHAGIVTKTPGERMAVHSHHARNSLSAVIQLAVLTTCGLSDHLQLKPGFRWSRHMRDGGWEAFLADTAAWAKMVGEWSKMP